MSDRIDELVDAVNKMTFTMADTWFDGSDVDASARFAAKDAVMETVTELATIAREAEARGFGHAQVVRLRYSVRQMLEYIGRHEQFCDAAALVAYNVDEMLRAVIPSTDLQRAFRATDERARKAEAMCELLAERLGAKAWMSLTGITRKALGGDDEPTRDAFVAAEAKSQLDAAREAVKS